MAKKNEITPGHQAELDRRFSGGVPSGIRLSTAADKALEKRGYDREPSTVTAYSNGIGSLEEIDPNSGEQGWMDTAKDIGKNANWAAVAANQVRLVPEYFTELLPMLRNISPLTLGTGAKTWGDWWEGQKYVGPKDYAQRLSNTHLEGNDKMGVQGFRKISKNQTDNKESQEYLDALMANNTISDDQIFSWILPLAKEGGWDVNSKEEASKMFNENEEFNTAVNTFIDELSNMPEYENAMIFGRDYFTQGDDYYIKNFKERPGFNVAWTQYDDLALPGLGVFKVNDDGQLSMLSAGSFNYEGIPGFEQLQKKGYWGIDPSEYGGTGMHKYQMMFDEENPYTQIASQLAAIPSSMVFNPSSVRNILHAPQNLKSMSYAKSLNPAAHTRPWKSKSGLPDVPGFPKVPRQPGMLEEVAKQATLVNPLVKGAYSAAKGYPKATGIGTLMPLYGHYGPEGLQ